ncbi:MAG TPA: tetratricopeptide repeat protein [Opitutaceae bacterium]|nr:tetratricopeptide repeat protein [Opitutaceae bacterium]
MSRLLFHLALLLATAAVALAEPGVLTARRLAREGLAAHAAGNEREYLAKLTAAVAAAPDYPRLLVNLAEAQVANGQMEEAVATLGKLADLGTHSPVADNANLAALRGRDDFKAVVKRIDANLFPVGDHEISFSLPEMTGLIEGIAWREKTNEFFFGDVHLRAVWVRAADGKVRRFTEPSDELYGVFGLAVDEERGALWAATSMAAGVAGYTPDQDGVAGLAEFDLATGRLRRVARLPLDHRARVIGDLALAPDGSVFATDSIDGALWRLAPGGKDLEQFLASDEFISLQGLAFSADGKNLFLTDHSNGLLRVNLAKRTVRRLDQPPNTTLLGLDGLVRAPDGDLIAVQNGSRPVRVLRLVVDDAGESVIDVKVLESAHLAMAEPALGCIANGDFYFIGNAGWSRFEGSDPKPTPPRPVPVFRTKLEGKVTRAK